MLYAVLCDFFCPTCIVGERASVTVKDEPAFLPGFNFSSHFNQIAAAGFFRDGQVEACVGAVACRLNVSPQVKIVLTNRQVPCQWSGLERKKKSVTGSLKRRGDLFIISFSVYIIMQMYITC